MHPGRSGTYAAQLSCSRSKMTAYFKLIPSSPRQPPSKLLVTSLLGHHLRHSPAPSQRLVSPSACNDDGCPSCEHGASRQIHEPDPFPDLHQSQSSDYQQEPSRLQPIYPAPTPTASSPSTPQPGGATTQISATTLTMTLGAIVKTQWIEVSFADPQEQVVSAFCKKGEPH